LKVAGQEPKSPPPLTRQSKIPAFRMVRSGVHAVLATPSPTR